MTTQYTRLISKYALILSVLLLIEYAFSVYIWKVDITFIDNRTVNALLPTGLTILLNVMTAILVKFDLDKLDIKAKYVTLATLLYKPVGVCAFLICVLLNKKTT